MERFGERLDSDLLPVGSDQAYFSGPDSIVDPGIGCGNRRITLSVGGSGPDAETAEARRQPPFVIARLQALLSTRRT
jgi:hypothetical protein